MEGTIKEIAEKVGRSESTVQRILGNRGSKGTEEEGEDVESPEEKAQREAQEEKEHIARLEKAQVEIAKHEDKGTKLEEEEEEEEESEEEEEEEEEGYEEDEEESEEEEEESEEEEEDEDKKYERKKEEVDDIFEKSKNFKYFEHKQEVKDIDEVTINGKKYEVKEWDDDEFHQIMEKGEGMYQKGIIKSDVLFLRGVYDLNELKNFYNSESIEPIGRIEISEQVTEYLESDKYDDFEDYITSEYLKDKPYTFDKDKGIFIADGVNSGSYSEVMSSTGTDGRAPYYIIFDGTYWGENLAGDGSIVRPSDIKAIYKMSENIF
jgi:flagellar biosynthesis GTPase FlhF